jgi:hypothetical protein
VRRCFEQQAMRRQSVASHSSRYRRDLGPSESLGVLTPRANEFWWELKRFQIRILFLCKSPFFGFSPVQTANQNVNSSFS